MTRASVLALTHGGGPLPLLNSPDQKTITRSLSTLAPAALKLSNSLPRAIVIITAHWETLVTTISVGENPALYYDYYGFPPEAYNISFEYNGSGEVAEEVIKTLREGGVDVKTDRERGWDHGVFVPLKLINPPPSIPLIQLSVLESQSPKELWKVGEALAPLRDRNIAIIGSGSAGFHNLRLLFSGAGKRPDIIEKGKKWIRKLDEVVGLESLEERRKQLLEWKTWEGASEMHPIGATEHFSPLVVCAAAAGDGIAKGWKDDMAGFEMGSYYWD